MSDMPPELLARHDGWLRQLVARLVGDDVDDVLQEVRLTAMRSPPRERSALPKWLATVARRVAGRRRRGAARRRAREQEVATRDDDGARFDPAELVQRVEARQRIAAAVLQLDEPFRSVVLLRYFEDLTPSQIAQRTGVPAATVRTRLFRAHQLLRERFGHEHGRDWRTALLLACPLPEGAATATSATPPLLLALAAVPLLALGSWWWLGAPPDAVPTQLADAGAAASPVAAAVDDAPRGEAPDRARVEQATDQADTPLPLPTMRVTGRVFRFDGAPLPQVPMVFVPERGGDPEQLGTSDHDGNFDVQVPAATPGHLETGGEFVALRTWPFGDHQDRSGIEAMVIAAPAVRLAGVVVDARGTPVPEQDVAVQIGDAFGFPLPAAACGRVFRWPSTRTDGNGAFRLPRVPGFTFGDLRVAWSSNETRVPLPAADSEDLRIVLGTGHISIPPRLAPSADAIVNHWAKVTGIVTDQAGQPLEGAIVREPRWSDGGTTTAADGSFETSARISTQQEVTLVAAAEDFAPRSFRIPIAAEGATTCTLVLDTAGAALSGRVVDAQGRALPDVAVMLADATPTHELHPTIAMEGVGHPDYGVHAITDGGGAFTITPVLERPYHLRVAELSTGYAKTFGPFRPGSDCAITLPLRRAHPVLRIVVADRSGVVVPDVRVRCSVTAQQLRTEDGGHTSTTSLPLGLDAATDAEGVLVYTDAPAGDLRLRLEKPGFEPREVTVAADGGGLVHVTLQRHVLMRIATKGVDERFVKVMLFDADGTELRIRQPWQGSFRSGGWQFGIHRGHSVVGAVVETAVRAELRDIFSDEVLREMPFVPVCDGVTVLDFPN
ncbi:MAG: sigma-70 family RNA polymerase sigma factor [Planctomycetes bacterium]|nr:sigma-70 family RNA polymerase sigma factor [Planctomycetota bacterium]